MLKNTTILAAGLCAAALLTPAVAQDGAATSDAAEKVELRLHLQKGQKFAFRQAVDISQDMDMQGMQISTTIDMTSDFAYEVLEVSEDGTAKVRVDFGRVKGSFANPMMGTLTFDSDTPAEPTGNQMMDMMAGAFTATANQTITVTMGSSGAVTSMEGVDAIVEKMLAANPMAAMGGLDAQSLSKQLTENIETMTGDYPAEPVGVGSTWELTRNMNQMNMEIELASKNTVTSVDADAIVFESTFKGDMSGGQMAQMFSVEEFTGTGESTLSRKDGLIQTSTARMNMKASIQGGAQGQGGMVMDMTTKLERIPVTSGAATTPSDDGAETGTGSGE